MNFTRTKVWRIC